MEFKDRLKDLRQSHNLSQEALAREIFVSRSAIAKWESGFGIPSDANLEALCSYFCVEEDWLMDRQDLKKQLVCKKRLLPVVIVALIAMISPFIYVLVCCGTTFHCAPNISYAYLPFRFFDFIVNFHYFGVENNPPFIALYILLCVSGSVWALTVIFGVLSLAVPKLRTNALLTISVNSALILLSLVLFVVLFCMTVQTASQFYYEFRIAMC